MKNYDVIILGGGFAGLTLALQLKQSRPDMSILVLEKRFDRAPVASHKVGESIAELGSNYLREVLGLKDYLNEHQLPKLGFRFFFGEQHKDNIARRVEVGSTILNPVPAHQLDRGLFENELMNRLNNAGVEIIPGAAVKNVELSGRGHQVQFEQKGNDCYIQGRWVIDSTGRSSLLKRKLGLGKALNHNINAAWFRMGYEIDIDDWSESGEWCTFLEPGQRRLSTNHLMGTGYWVWLIPLISGNTSIGIVADPSFHPFDQFNTFDKAMKWLELNEPVAAKMIGANKERLIDFKVMKNFAYDCKQLYSAERWGLTGDAGAFMDPFYSPGADFIALNNTWITDLIVREISGEDIVLLTMIYGRAHRELLNGWMLLYRNMYGLFGKTQIMLMKIVWDWGTYWAIPALLFINKGYTNMAVLKQYSATSNSIGQRFSTLNKRMQELFLTWGQQEIEPCSDHYLNVFDLDYLYQFHKGLDRKYEPEGLIEKVAANLKMLEQISAEIFRLVSAHIHDTPPDMSVDPYRMAIHDQRSELLEKSKGSDALGVVESIRADISRVWLVPVKKKYNEYAG